MNRHTILILLASCLAGITGHGQSSQGPKAISISSQVPKITPAAPTVASLMKFEEIPVNNYTGIPDVSIPLYSLATLSKDVSMDISLKYHPASIAIDETASYTGLGWNLFAGGSISRTVKGYPDELYGGIPDKIGILQDNINDSSGGELINRYHQIYGRDGTQGTSEDEKIMIGTYVWDASERGVFDTEHDLFQYNFMGYTGRFYIKRNTQTGLLEPIKLDNNNALTIKLITNENAYDYNYYTHRYTIDFRGFEIYDDKGYKYVFGIEGTNDGTEVTNDVTSVQMSPFHAANVSGTGNDIISPTNLTYKSAFNLLSVYDNNNQKLINLTYSSAPENIVKKTNSDSYFPFGNSILSLIWDNDSMATIFGLLPEYLGTLKTLTTQTKKVHIIEVTNKGRIVFDTQTGRDDINSDAPYLNGLEVFNHYNEKVKKITFDYGYSSITSYYNFSNNITRLILTGISDINPKNSNDILYQGLNYNNPNVYVSTPIKKDFWGYFSRRPYANKEPDEESITTGVLSSISLPSGGRIEFDFGPNTYSYIGNEPVTDFSIDDEENMFQITVPVGPGGETFNPEPTKPVSDIFFVPESPIEGGSFSIRPDDDNTWYSLNALGSGRMNDGTGASQTLSLSSTKKYYIKFEVPDGSPTNLSGKLSVFKSKSIKYDENGQPLPDNQWLMGGGIRINKISYFKDSGKDPIKVKNYSYNQFNNPLRSSGSLVFAKPVYNYQQTKSAWYPGGGAGVNSQIFNVSYNTMSDFNNLSYIRTQGSDVGYKNVRVWETENGKSEYTYTSPIDYPEESVNMAPPFYPSDNKDYKRGLLLNEKHFSERKINDVVQFKLIKETSYSFAEDQMDEVSVVTGFLPALSAHPMSQQFTYFFEYYVCALTCSYDWAYENMIWGYLSLGGGIKQVYGWPKLTTKVSKDYFYTEGVSAVKVVSTTETYKYNQSNKQISESTSTNSLGEVLKTNYFYDYNTAGRNRVGILKGTETRRDNKLIEKKDINFLNNRGLSNDSYLPAVIAEAKGNNQLEAKVEFLKYDIYSNPLSAKQVNGNDICYIWGYDSTQPIAVIENMTYSALHGSSTLQSYIDAAVNASNDINNSDTTILRDKLKLLQSNLPASASMTGYTYKPLIGVIDIIDARGSVIKYSYDGFGRLETVKDEDGNLLSENKYHYKAN